MNVSSKRLVTDLLVLAGFCGFLFFFGLGAIGLTGADEPRYAQIAREMLARHDWVTPVLYGQPWLEKPILYYWQAMLSFSVFGVSDWAARVPAAVDMTAMVVAVYFFVRRFWRGAELDAALITASCAFIIGFGHAASTDAPLAATFTIALLAWLTWHLTGRKLWLAGFYLLLALATLAKGPVAVFLAGLVLVAFALVRRELSLLWRSLWLPGIALYLAVTLPWYVLVQLHTGTFFRVFILEHNLARYATEIHRHVQPFWYFGVVALAALLPWTVLGILGFVRGVKQGFSRVQQRDDISLFLVLWGGLPILFFSFSGSKLPGYILPMIPALALLAAGYLRHKLEEGARPNRIVVLLHSLLTGAVLGAALLTPYLVMRMRPPQQALTVAVLAGAVAFAVVAITIHRSGLKMLRFVTLLPILLAMAFLLRTAAPSVDETVSSRPLARQIGGLVPAGVPVAGLDIRREVEYGLAFYRNRQVVRYERGEQPAAAHVLITRTVDPTEIARQTQGRALLRMGRAPLDGMEIYWVAEK